MPRRVTTVSATHVLLSRVYMYRLISVGIVFGIVSGINFGLASRDICEYGYCGHVITPLIIAGSFFAISSLCSFGFAAYLYFRTKDIARIQEHVVVVSGAHANVGEEHPAEISHLHQGSSYQAGVHNPNQAGVLNPNQAGVHNPNQPEFGKYPPYTTPSVPHFMPQDLYSPTSPYTSQFASSDIYSSPNSANPPPQIGFTAHSPPSYPGPDASHDYSQPPPYSP